MEVKLTDEQMEVIVRKTILDAMPDVERDKIIAEAVRSLLTTDVETGKPWDRLSRLQEIFNMQVTQIAHDMAREVLSQPDVEKKIKGLFTDVMERAFAGDNYDKLVDEIASAFCNKLWDQRY